MNSFRAALVIVFAAVSSAFADGFRLTWALETIPHVVVILTPTQIDEVGSRRCLTLTADQKQKLSQNLKSIPRVLGVESLGEPDCSCCICPVMWTAIDRVTIWLPRYSNTKDLTKYYRTVRERDRHFVMDSKGRVFQKGKEISIDRLREIASTGEFGVHLAMPPDWPPKIEARLKDLREAGRISSKL